MGAAAVSNASKLGSRAPPYTVPMKAVQLQCCTLGRVRPARFGLMPKAAVDMDRSARLFLCALCRDQVLLCSFCDRGQQYCSRACSSVSRRERRREAAQRYQSSRRGQLKHAARTACWRQRRRQRAASGAVGEVDKVTHQGCPDGAAQAPLALCDTPNTCEPMTLPSSAHIVMPAGSGAVAAAVWVCRRCARRLLPHVRLDYLRPNSAGRRRAHDHLSVELAARIKRLYTVEHWRVGTIARQLQVHRDTVRRVLREHQVVPPGVPLRPSLIDPYRAFIGEALAKYPTLAASRLYDMVCERGYAGQASHFRHWVSTMRPRPPAEAFLRLRTLPGEQMQIDWALCRARHSAHYAECPGMPSVRPRTQLSGDVLRRLTRHFISPSRWTPPSWRIKWNSPNSRRGRCCARPMVHWHLTLMRFRCT